MKITKLWAAVLVSGCFALNLSAQTMAGGNAAAPGNQATPSAALDSLAGVAEEEVVGLAKAMPADRYNFAPNASIFVPGQKTDFAGVRTFGQLVIHVAQTNYGLAAKVGGLKPEIDPKSLAKLTDKDQIIEALEASFAYVHKSIATLTPANSFEIVSAPFAGPMTRATMAAFVAVHTTNECGQMVEYLRMNALIPPTSQKK